MNTRSTHGLLEVGRNCDSLCHADRFSVLIDAAVYFSALREAIRGAQHTVFIVGWDINSRMKLVPQGAADGFPEPLGAFLQAVASANRRLRIYVLAWDFAMIYAFEREWMPVYPTGWRSHRRILFRMDNTHPRGASHHPKFVVVDDRLAFVGGLDLTRARWDTPAHAANDPWRRNPDGSPYNPFHDVHTVFDGEAARAIGQLARGRWHRACGKTLAIRAERNLSGTDPWPSSVPVDVHDVVLGIALTAPPYRNELGVQHIRTLTVDIIEATQHNLYIENQYLTAAVVRDALSRRLEDPHAPDVAVVVPRNHSGWLQEATMGALRARLHRALTQADRHGHYRLWYPHIDGLHTGCLNVHSKLMISDNERLCVGSANLNNRSMVLDTECNVVLDANGSDRVRAMIASIRDRLLAEHLDVSPEAVAAALQHHGRLNGAIDALRHDARTLTPLDPTIPPELEALVPVSAWADPEVPIEPDALVRQFLDDGQGARPATRLLLLGAFALALATLAALWRFTPAGQALSVAHVVHWGERLAALPLTPAIVLLGYVVASLAAVPITLIIVATGLVFGTWPGAAYALVGTMLAAAATYYVGVGLGRDAVRRLAGSRANRLSERIGKRGLLTILVLRLVPVAPFSIVNLVAGASHIGIREFLLGTLLGMAPGTVLTVTFAHQLVASIRHPDAGSLALLIGIGTALVALSILLHKLLKKY
ncbi:MULTISPECIES: VTT domain-containing protein [Mycetohabitans]|uniref:VTT domain-containing protein n=1 Tax=Mycetohabitans TaxID=2571159 RepID=UPI001F24A674|nr:VTT domain-containing protein [Mycetohabitans sp. B3]MCF2135396.1 VTT domain-containing protein [Mycetohabitans sp. B3]